jgi:hypothetical protein
MAMPDDITGMEPQINAEPLTGMEPELGGELRPFYLRNIPIMGLDDVFSRRWLKGLCEALMVPREYFEDNATTSHFPTRCTWTIRNDEKDA